MPAEQRPEHDQETTGTVATTAALRSLTREVEEFVAGAGWDQSPQLFALVPTADLVQRQPELAGQVDADSALTPIAQEQLPSADLAQALAEIIWPRAVHGCVVAQEIVVLPPDVERELDARGEDSEHLRRIAAEHPRRREGRMVAAVLRDGVRACVLRLRAADEFPEEIVEHPDLAPNLTTALHQTLHD